MILFYIKSRVYIKVFGLSGESQEIVSAIPLAPNVTVAKQKYEAHCKEKYKKMEYENIRFEYLEIAPQI